MNKALTSAVLFWGVGLPILIYAQVQGGLYKNITLTLIALIFIILGFILYTMIYSPKDRQIEKELVKRNKLNWKK